MLDQIYKVTAATGPCVNRLVQRGMTIEHHLKRDILATAKKRDKLTPSGSSGAPGEN